jgi:hypothetical protein
LIQEITEAFGSRLMSLQLISFYENQAIPGLGVCSSIILLMSDHRG